MEEEKCCLCGDKFYSGSELTNHLALQHFHHGLLQELLAQGWEDGDLRCPQCGELGGGGAESVLLHWATQHNRVEALVKRCYAGGRCSLYRDKLLCNDYLQKRSQPRIKILPSSKLARAFYQAEQERDSQEDDEEEEEDIIVLDGSDSSGDEIEVLEEILTQKQSKAQHSSSETKKATKTAAVNNNGPGHSIKTDLSNNNDEAQQGDEEIIVETILERISSASSKQSEVSGKQLQLKVPKAEHQVNSCRPNTVITDSRQLSKAAVENLRTATVCKICSKSFPSRREFQDHLASQHFRLELEREILRAGPGRSCPSCSHFKSKDLTGLIVHYGARCKPFPVNKLYSNWLSQSRLGISTDICVFCGAKAHSPNDLVFHLIDKHVGDVLQKMDFTFFFKFQKVRDRDGSFADILTVCGFQLRGDVLEYSCPSCARTEEDQSKLCLHFMRQHETFFIEIYQNFSRLAWCGARCVLCGEKSSSPHNYLQHLLSQHYSQSLLSECGRTSDFVLACSSCEFLQQDTHAMVSHYALQHHRLEFFYTESLTKLAEQGRIEASHFNLQTEIIGLDDFER